MKPSNCLLVTIVTPCLNGAKTIEQTLASINDQEGVEVEHLVVDGGSTDETERIVSRFERSRFVRLPGKNQSAALNFGFLQGQGKFFGWLNADDFYFDRHVLRRSIDAFNTNPQKGLVYGDVVYLSDKGKRQAPRRTFSFSRARLLRYAYIPQPTIVFRREVVDEFLIDESLEFVMDAEWMLRVSAKYDFGYIPRFQAAFRCHNESKVHTMGKLRYQSESTWLRGRDADRRPLACLADRVRNAMSMVSGAQRFGSLSEAEKADFLRYVGQMAQ